MSSNTNGNGGLEIKYPEPPSCFSAAIQKAMSVLYGFLLFSSISEQDLCLAWMSERLKEVKKCCDNIVN